ncbi:hypothetical protein BKA62DRAFT_181847 [Auriculariales sp. MPI-PUGE-AT-0066]|nr:hypothetical protein BKA62DRAFT_181847 [Auriculariales sp. MPI-PUGE-AT-0066]
MDHASVRRYSTFGLPSQRTLDYIKRVEVDQAHTSHNSPASHRRALSLPPKTRAEDWEEAQYARERDKTKLSFSARQDDIASWAPRWKQLGVTTERGTTTDSESDSVSSSVASQASRISAWMSDRQSEASKTSLSSHWDTSSATSSTSQYDVLSRTGTCEPDEYQEWRTHAPIVGYSDASRLPPSQRAVARPRPIDSSDTNFSVIQDGEEADHVSPSAPLRSTGDPSIDEPLAAVMTRPQVLVFTPQNAHVTNALILHNHVQLLGYELHWHERPFRNQWKSLALSE